MAARRAGMTLAASLVLVTLPAAAALPQIRLPAGFSAGYHTEYSFGQTEFSTGNQPIFENWLELDYSHIIESRSVWAGDVTGGIRFVAFAPPDSAVYIGDSSHGIDRWYAEYTNTRARARGGDFYAMFGRGLTLRIYEERTLRIDTNVRGAVGTYYLPDGEITALAGRTVAGPHERADRPRSEPVYGIDFEHGVWEAANLRVGGSLISTDLGDSEGRHFEPQRMKGARASATLLGVDLLAEYARVDGPNVGRDITIGARRRGFDGPNFHGTGVYGVATTFIGGVGLLFEVKDYDVLLFKNDSGEDYNVPPALIREHAFNLLNRHPHQLDTADEVGYQAEVKWVTDRIFDVGDTSWLLNWSRTRNHDHPGLQGNYFDEVYLDIEQTVGGRGSVIAALSYQKVFETPTLRTLWTPIADVQVRLTDTHALHIQLEHQHDRSEVFGKFDTEFLVVEWTRSPDLTVGLLYEHGNKSSRQLELLSEDRNDFVGGSLDYSLLGQIDLRAFYGRRNAGFICVGGVCRQEPAFDGFEFSLVSRF